MIKKTICDYIHALPERKTKNPAITFMKDKQWQNLSWPEYYDRVEIAASALLAVDVKPSDKVAIMSNTRWEWSVTDCAIMSVQAITVPIYQTVTAQELEHILNNSEAKVLFVENRATLRTFVQVQSRCPSVKKVICFDQTSESDLNFTTWDEFYALGAQEKSENKTQIRKLMSSTKLSDIATLIYTSGTTGQPKGVVLTHEQIMSEIGEAFPLFGVGEDDISLSFLPYAHVMGRIEHWGAVMMGYNLAFAESIERVRLNLIDIRPTFMIAVPRIFEKVYAAISSQMEANFVKSKMSRWALHVGQQVSECKIQKRPIPVKLFAEYQVAKRLVLDKIKAAFGGRLKFAISGGAPLAREIALFFHSCDVMVMEGYGLTETTAAICVNTLSNYQFGTVGKPIGDVQIKFAADGEILVKSKKVMREYYKNPEATAETIQDGWFHTGDIGELTPSGLLKITDRKKDLIKTAGGKYVAPQRLENLLKLNNFVSNVLIHGDQRKYIVALITIDKAFLTNFAKEKNISYNDMNDLSQNPQVLEMARKGVAETNSQLAHFESIKRFAVLPNDFTVESGELTPSLKVKRKVLDRKYAKQLESLYN